MTLQKPPTITCVFVDIGGVLLTDGWDRHGRQRASAQFKLDLAETEERHQRTWDTHQAGKLTLAECLGWVVFYQQRTFTQAQFRQVMFAQSKADPEMIELIRALKAQHRLKIAVVSNEGREVNIYRTRKFRLDGFVDAFISSCFVRLLKRDADIFRLAQDIVQVPAERVVYIENTELYARVAEGLGIRSIRHTTYDATRADLAAIGLLRGDCSDHAAG